MLVAKDLFGTKKPYLRRLEDVAIQFFILCEPSCAARHAHTEGFYSFHTVTCNDSHY